MTPHHPHVAPSRRDGHLSDLDLERLAFEPASATVALVEHAGSCASCAARVAAHEAHQQRFEPAPLRLEVMRAANRPKEPRWWLRGSTAGFALAAAVLLSVGVISMQRSAHDPLDVRVKGAEIELEVFVHDGTDVRRAEARRPVHPGDRLGFRVTPRFDGHLLVVGFDADGAYPCWPPAEADGVEVEATGGAHELDAAVRLDDRLGDERIVAVLCEDSIGFEEAAEMVAEGEAEGSCVSDELILHKVPR